jgi:dUTP pyrophosphatase
MGSRTRGFEIVKDEHRKHKDVNIILPKRATKHSAGWDFYMPCDVVIPPKETVVVWSDVKAYMQENEVLMIHIRSSLGIKKNLQIANITGVIDMDYYSNDSNDGNIAISLYNRGEDEVVLRREDKVCQGVFQPFLVADNDEPVSTVRTGGIGSSGK